MQNDKAIRNAFILMAFLFSLLGFFVGLTYGYYWGRDKERAYAIYVGVAEWRCDPQTGETSYHYNIHP